MTPKIRKVNPIPDRSTAEPSAVEVVELAGRRKWPDDSATVALRPVGEWHEVTLAVNESKHDPVDDEQLIRKLIARLGAKHLIELVEEVSKKQSH